MITDDDIDIIVATLVGDDDFVADMLDEPDMWENNYREIIASAVGEEAGMLDEEDLLEIKESVEDVVAADALADDAAYDDEKELDELDAEADRNATGFDQHTKNVMHAAQEVAKALASGDEGTASVKVQENDGDDAPDRVVIEDVPSGSEEKEDDIIDNNDESGDISNDAKNSIGSIAKHLSSYRW